MDQPDAPNPSADAAQRWERLARRLPSPTGWLLILLGVGVAWRVVRYALGFPIWGDEAFVAINFVARDYRSLMEPLLWGQIVPLAFMWAELALSRLLGLSEWALRLLPFVSGLAALGLFAWWSRHVLPQRAALLATGILAASLYAVRHAAEVKPYATDLLIALLLLMAAWAVLERSASAWRWLLLILLALLVPWCSYPGVFVAGAVGLALTCRLLRGPRSAGLVVAWLLFGVALCGSFAAMYVLYGRPHAEAAARLTEISMWTQAFPPLALREIWKLPIWLVVIHTGRMFAFPYGDKAPSSLITLVLFIIGVVHLWRRRQFEPLVLLVGPLPLAFVAAALHAYPYGGTARTMLYFAPAICLLAGLGAHVLLRRYLHGWRLRLGTGAAFAGLVLFAVGGMAADALSPYQTSESQRSHDAVAKLAHDGAAGDVWVVFNADRPVPYAPFIGDWRGVGGQFVFDAARFAPGRLLWAPVPADIPAPAGGRVCLLLYRAKHPKVEFDDAQWQAYLAAVSARFGTPAVRTFPVKTGGTKVETIEAYEYPR